MVERDSSGFVQRYRLIMYCGIVPDGTQFPHNAVDARRAHRLDTASVAQTSMIFPAARAAADIFARFPTGA